MLTQEVLDYFGSKMATARALGITRQAIQGWEYVVPLQRAWRIEDLTKGKLKVKLGLYRTRNSKAA